MIKRRKLALVALCAALFGSAAYVGYRDVSHEENSDLLLANVEALADDDVDAERGPSKYKKCDVCDVTVKFCECENHSPCHANLCKCYP